MGIEHIAMYVDDLEKAKTFFMQFLDGKSNDEYYNEKTGFRSYFLSFDSGARLELMTRPDLSEGQKEPYQTGYAHIAFSVGTKERVDDLTKSLRDAGYEVVSGPRTTGDGYYESCIAAIEGNLIELTV